MIVPTIGSAAPVRCMTFARKADSRDAVCIVGASVFQTLQL